MTNERLPVLGAALPVALLPEYRDWLLEGQRDLEIQDAYRPEVLDGDWRPLVAQAKAALDGYTGRLGIHGPFDGLTIMSRDPAVRELATRRLRQGLELGAALGATHMVVHSPFIFFGDAFLPHAPAFDQATQFELVHAVLDPVLPLARESGCTLVIEGILDKNPAPLLALIRSFDDEHVRLSIDTGHAYITHLAGGPTPDGWAWAAGDLLGHLHLQDTDGRIDRHWAPGDGLLNWYALFEALGALAHRPRLIIEVKDKEQIRRGADWLVARGLAR
jgi:sugar phosphate isomerase/epimerase